MDIFSQPTDQQALNLTHSIALQESSKDGKTPNYNAVGDAGTSKGAYQWQPGNFESAAKHYGLDPNDFSPQNQDKVAYAQVKAYKDKGYDPGQVASLWNSGSPDNWQNHSGTTTINGQQIHYDTPKYVQGVKSYYQKLSGSSNPGNTGYQQPTPPGTPSQQPSGSPVQGYEPPTPPTPPTTNGQEIPTENSQPENNWQKAGDVAKGVGNFLFPIVGDVYHDIKGDNKKTFLQQAGDTALSALPFIPGLGEAGEGARAVEAGVEGGEAIAGAAKGGGLLGKFLGSSAAKGAVTGYGAGVASNLSQGQGLGQAFKPNMANIGGAVLGSVTPIALKALGGIAEKVSGINPQIANELKNLGTQGNPEDVELANNYITAAKDHATNIRATAPLTVAANNLDEAAQKISQATDQAGAAVGAAKQAGASIPLGDTSSVTQNFQKQVAERFGINLGIDEGGKVLASPIEGSMRQIAPKDVSRITNVFQQLTGLQDGATAKNASEVISNLNDLIEPPSDVYGKVRDPLEGLLAHTTGEIDSSLRQASPNLATANDKFSQLKDLQKEIQTMAGKNLQKGELLMKRVFSGDKSGDVNRFFETIKNATGIDLVKHAVLARWAIESYGGQADKSLLQQAIEGGAQGHAGLLNFAANAARGVAKKTFANPEKIGKNLVAGKTGGLLGNFLTKTAARTGGSL